MGWKPYVLWPIAIMGGLIVVLLMAFAIVIAFEITIPLNAFRDKVESVASDAIGRKVSIKGPLELTPSLWPALEMHGFRIADLPSTKDPAFLQIDFLRARVRILPLFQGKIHMEEINGQGIEINLERRSTGSMNWEFITEKKSPSEQKDVSGSESAPLISSLEVGHLSLRGLNVYYRDHLTDRYIAFSLDELEGKALFNEPLYLRFQGYLQQKSLMGSFQGDPLSGIFFPAKPWHMDIQATWGGTTLSAQGQIVEPLRGIGLDVALYLRGDRLEDLLSSAGVPPTLTGPFAFRARLAETAAGYHLSKGEGEIGDTPFSGDFVVNLSGERPRLKALLHLDTLDFRPIITLVENSIDADSEEKRDLSKKAPGPSNAPFHSLDFLKIVDADLSLSIDEVIHGPLDIRNISFQLILQDGILTSPVMLILDDAPFQGTLKLDNAHDVAHFELTLGAKEIQIVNLARIFLGTEDIEGHLETFEFNLTSYGESMRSLLENSALHFAIANGDLSYGHKAQEKPVRFSIDRTRIALAKAERMQIDARGALLDVPFEMTLSGGRMEDFLERRAWPIDLTARGAGVHLSLWGTALALTDEGGPQLQWKVSGKRLSDLAPWLGVPAKAKLPYGFSGKIKMTKRGWDLGSLKAYLGKTRLSGAVVWKGTMENPLVTAKLVMSDLDLIEFSRLSEMHEPREREKGLILDLPILPREVSIGDANLDIAIHRVNFENMNVKNVRFSGRIRNGFIEKAPFQGDLGKVRFRGSIGLDLRRNRPEVYIDVNAGPVDIGQLLEKLNLAEGVEADVADLNAQLFIKGHTLRSMLESPDITVRLKGGHFILRDPNTHAGVIIRIPYGVLKAPPGENVTLKLDSKIKNSLFSIEIQTAMLASILSGVDQIPLQLKIEGLGHHMDLRSVVPLPVNPKSQEFMMSLRGERLDSLNDLLDVDFPPLGPFRLEGRLGVNREGYYVSDFKSHLSNSASEGSLILKTNSRRPSLDADLTTRTLQLNDFEFGDWSLLGKEDKEVEDENDLPKTARNAEGGVMEGLLSPDFLKSFDARLTYQVEEVLSGEDRLGSGTFKALVKDGRLIVDPLQLDIPGGSVNLSFTYAPTDANVHLDVKAQIEQFDYGVVARRIDPESDMAGWLSLDVAMRSTSDTMDTIMAHASGHIDFAIVPEDFEAGLFELWAVNLLAAALTPLDSEAKSVFNCAVFRLNLEDGLLEQDVIFVDTTKMQVQGEGKVDFKTGELSLLLTPRAKRPEYFSLATPITVNGTISDYHIGIRPGGFIATAIRFIFSPIHVSFRRLFREETPANGRSACTEAMHRPE